MARGLGPGPLNLAILQATVVESGIQSTVAV